MGVLATYRIARFGTDASRVFLCYARSAGASCAPTSEQFALRPLSWASQESRSARRYKTIARFPVPTRMHGTGPRGAVIAHSVRVQMLSALAASRGRRAIGSTA